VADPLNARERIQPLLLVDRRIGAVPADHDNLLEPYGQLWLDNYGPVAREFGMTIVGVSNVGPITAGPWQGRRCIGNSLVVGPEGVELARGPYGERAEELLVVEL